MIPKAALFYVLLGSNRISARAASGEVEKTEALGRRVMPWLSDRNECRLDVVERLTGLIGVSRLASGHGIYFQNCRWLHTCCVRFAIDVVFFDKQRRVIGERRNMQPWRVEVFSRQFPGMLELPTGSLGSLGIRIGSYVCFEFVNSRQDIAREDEPAPILTESP
jgi:hypothetical protein